MESRVAKEPEEKTRSCHDMKNKPWSVSGNPEQAAPTTQFSRRFPQNRLSQKLPTLKISTSSLPNTVKNTESNATDQSLSPYRSTLASSSNVTSNQPYPNGPVCIYPPNIYLYAKPSMPILQSFDVVVNVAKEVVQPFTTEGRYYRDSKHNLDVHVFDCLEYIHIPWEHDSQFVVELDQLVSFVTYQAICLNKRVLINCQMGISRSACLVIAFIMKTLNLNVSDAYEYVKKRSPWIGPNMSLIFQLSEYQQMIRKDPDSTSRPTNPFFFPEKPYTAQLPLSSASSTDSLTYPALRKTRSSGSVNNESS
ncbi:dual-specificity MAP kinase phosphatase Pmp1 [Schizosaccharomyces cryophilus OY26]|uniref:protein-tyrosine-phosphatase n=1 Tax=Schizosaccharomyces cryophilus (strain OY26 / ATCC MYA-4695 / CBS 11777 / NBRC 106824 / NRRL Y48691) TaxID=653667 RepID=S9X0L8_SCHCR|nr:dual-specificity MAP kinase phosphatase Pmp1 [Schizosaccharomyces cryophilus OY26]EPY50517.1 dual-specificity MAP kinase phosphatase Pmp1 [Schizosaccharomyces cryophilus OY26]